MIIGLSGHIKSGKSTAAQLIQTETNNKFVEKYFAYKLKFIASYLTGEPIVNFETQEGKEGYLDDWGMTRREILQKLGTESLRTNFHNKVWIKALFADYKEQVINADGAGNLTYEYPNWIISDCRFPNEANEIKERGGIILRINRPVELIYPTEYQRYQSETKASTGCSEKGFHQWLSYGDQKEYELFKKLTHPSETGLDDYTDFDFVIQNDSTFENYEFLLKNFITETITNAKI